MSVRAKLAQTALLGGAGAALAYFLDPEQGRGRRAETRDRLVSKSRKLTTEVETRARYAEGRLQGLRARAGGRGHLDPRDDHLIKQGIEQQLARGEVDTRDVVIDVNDGVVGLRGQLSSADEVHEVEAEASKVPGVVEVRSWLHLPGTPAPNKAAARRAS